MKKGYGIAIDIGTTAVTAGLWDLERKKEIAGPLIEFNPQSRFGPDVVSRIDYCLNNKNGLHQLHKAVRTGVNRLIERLLKQARLGRKDLARTVIAANTAMQHFFLKAPVEKLAQAPYSSVLPKGVIEAEGGVYLLPTIKSFVGSDLTAGILYTGLLSGKSANMLVDIGTNGEIALTHNGRLFVASTAAGPAFEPKDKGTSGSKLIEAMAAMLAKGLIDKTGRLLKVPCPGITQQDIRKVQVAKAAIISGILALIRNARLGLRDIRNVYVAGRFGNYLDKKAAVRIGLLPDIAVGRIRFVNNAAYKGAALALCSKTAMEKCEWIAKKAVHIGLFGRKDFKEDFIKHMGF
jgi:uncharacterized 2Fe-2S/4Fe-4S cluster protein (DUF4445 family)